MIVAPEVTVDPLHERSVGVSGPASDREAIDSGCDPNCYCGVPEGVGGWLRVGEPGPLDRWSPYPGPPVVRGHRSPVPAGEQPVIRAETALVDQGCQAIPKGGVESRHRPLPSERFGRVNLASNVAAGHRQWDTHRGRTYGYLASGEP